MLIPQYVKLVFVCAKCWNVSSRFASTWSGRYRYRENGN